MSEESMKDAVLKNLEANLVEALNRGDEKEAKRIMEKIENVEKGNMNVKRGNSESEKETTETER